MSTQSEPPLLQHPLDEESAFQPQGLIAAVRKERSTPPAPIPPVCVLEFDGDLTDWIVEKGLSARCAAWSCFHTAMEEIEMGGFRAGIVSRTIGGPYAVLIAEQMLASGAEVVLGLTSAGRVSGATPLPSLVVATRALRDEGTSLHYIAASRYVEAPKDVASALATELTSASLPMHLGPVWTTDAPYRETATQLARHAGEGILAVEMQAASLFGLAQAKRARIGVVAHMTNATDNVGRDFDKGSHALSLEIISRMIRAGHRLIAARG